MPLNYSIFNLSYYLYNISQPTKYGVPQLDLSEDAEARVDSALEESFSSNQLCIERVMVKLFTKYHCNVVITDRLRSIFFIQTDKDGQGNPSMWWKRTNKATE